MAFTKKPLFAGIFQAWVHGPVNRDIYDRFKDTKYLYTALAIEDVRDMDIATKIDEDSRRHIEIILETYASYSGFELEEMTHREDPRINARKGYRPPKGVKTRSAKTICEISIAIGFHNYNGKK